MTKKYLIIILLLINIFLISKEYKKYSKSTITMGTNLTIILFSYENEKIINDIFKQCFERANYLESLSSCKLENSIVSQINKNQIMDITDDFILDLIKESIYYAKITDGYFDPTLYNIIDLWGFEKGDKKVPDLNDIEKNLLKTGYKNVFIENNKIILKNSIKFDFGGIAKGKIIGEIANLLKKNNINDFIVNGGGDLVLSGLYQNKRLWRIAIADPFNNNNLIGEISLTDCAIVTSGDYERFFIDNGIKYHHIINPKNGKPANNGVHSVTVITDLPSKADAFATALFVMGSSYGLKFLKKYKEIQAIFISGDKNSIIIETTDKIKSQKNNEKFEFQLINY